jgi:predicted enzyme related to lactoylglutathione lyase
MKTKELGLVWIVVKDIQASIKYYTDVVGLKLMEVSEEYGWAELEGHEGGVRLGLAQENAHDDMKAGCNAVLTFSVADLDKALEEMLKKGAQAKGEVLEIPGHVKMQTMVDADGNVFQMCQVLKHQCCHC